MTLEEAIKILSELHDQCCQADSIFCTDTTGARCEAVDMAISALRAQDLQQTCNKLATNTIDRQAAIDAVSDALKRVFVEHEDVAEKILCKVPSAQPEPCEDAVSRQRLLNDLKELKTAWEKYPVMAEQIKGVETAIGYVEAIPSVTSKRKE